MGIQTKHHYYYYYGIAADWVLANCLFSNWLFFCFFLAGSMEEVGRGWLKIHNIPVIKEPPKGNSCLEKWKHCIFRGHSSSVCFSSMSLSPRLTMSLKTPHAVANKCQEHTKSARVYMHRVLLVAAIATFSPTNIVKFHVRYTLW